MAYLAQPIPRLLLVISSAISMGASSAALAVTLEIVALEGGPPPAGPSGTVFSGTSTPGSSVRNEPLLNRSAQLLLEGGLRSGAGGVMSENDAVVWGPGQNGALSVVLREGDQAPGAPFGATFQRFFQLTIGDGGHVLTRALVSGTDEHDVGIWGPDATGDLALLAFEGKAVPGVPGAIFESFSGPAVNPIGQAAFVATLEEGVGGVEDGDDVVILGPDAGGNLAPLLREGDPAPSNDPPGETVRTFTAIPPRGFLPDGSMLVTGTVTGSSSDSRLIWSRTGTGPFTSVARSGAAAPGLGGAVFFSFAHLSRINAASVYLFSARLTQGVGGVTQDDDT